MRQDSADLSLRVGSRRSLHRENHLGSTLSQISADNMLVARTGFIKGSHDAAMVPSVISIKTGRRVSCTRDQQGFAPNLTRHVARYRSMGDTQRLALQAIR